MSLESPWFATTTSRPEVFRVRFGSLIISVPSAVRFPFSWEPGASFPIPQTVLAIGATAWQLR